MTTITPIFTGVAAHIAIYADAVAVSGGGGTQIFVSGTPGLREDGTPPEDFTDEPARGSRSHRHPAGMSDPSAKITARRVDTDVAVIGAPSKDPVAHEEGRPRS
jgi:hypothetical protein